MAESNSYAVIRTGGKQYTAAPGQRLVVERLEGEVGAEVVFNDVLLVKTAEKGVTVGRPLVEGATVKAKIIAHERAKKVLIFKKRRRKGYTKKQGHRQEVTRVEIQSVA
jgi:large subunit ribosomal protein L21